MWLIPSTCYTQNLVCSDSSQNIPLVNTWGSQNADGYLEIKGPSFYMLSIHMWFVFLHYDTSRKIMIYHDGYWNNISWSIVIWHHDLLWCHKKRSKYIMILVHCDFIYRQFSFNSHRDVLRRIMICHDLSCKTNGKMVFLSWSIMIHHNTLRYAAIHLREVKDHWQIRLMAKPVLFLLFLLHRFKGQPKGSRSIWLSSIEVLNYPPWTCLCHLHAYLTCSCTVLRCKN